MPRKDETAFPAIEDAATQEKFRATAKKVRAHEVGLNEALREAAQDGFEIEVEEFFAPDDEDGAQPQVKVKLTRTRDY